MADKNSEIITYIYNKANMIQSQGYPVTQDQMTRAAQMFVNSPKSLEQIKQEIDELVEQHKNNIRERKSQKPHIQEQRPSNELSRMLENEAPKKEETRETPMKKTTPQKVFVKKDKDKGFASTMSLTSSIGLIVGISLLFMIIFLLMK